MGNNSHENSFTRLPIEERLCSYHNPLFFHSAKGFLESAILETNPQYIPTPSTLTELVHNAKNAFDSSLKNRLSTYEYWKKELGIRRALRRAELELKHSGINFQRTLLSVAADKSEAILDLNVPEAYFPFYLAQASFLKDQKVIFERENSPSALDFLLVEELNIELRPAVASENLSNMTIHMVTNPSFSAPRLTRLFSIKADSVAQECVEQIAKPSFSNRFEKTTLSKDMTLSAFTASFQAMVNS